MEHRVVFCNMGDAHFASGRAHAKGDGIELDLGDPAVLSGEACHASAPDVFHDTVAPGSILTAVVHIFADHGVVGHTFVLEGIRRLQPDCFCLEDEVTQAVENGLVFIGEYADGEKIPRSHFVRVRRRLRLL